MEIIGWYNETKTGGVGSVSKIHITHNGQTTLCGAKPSGRNWVMDALGNDTCSKCEKKHEADTNS